MGFGQSKSEPEKGKSLSSPNLQRLTIDKKDEAGLKGLQRSALELAVQNKESERKALSFYKDSVSIFIKNH